METSESSVFKLCDGIVSRYTNKIRYRLTMPEKMLEFKPSDYTPESVKKNMSFINYNKNMANKKQEMILARSYINGNGFDNLVRMANYRYVTNELRERFEEGKDFAIFKEQQFGMKKRDVVVYVRDKRKKNPKRDTYYMTEIGKFVRSIELSIPDTDKHILCEKTFGEVEQSFVEECAKDIFEAQSTDIECESTRQMACSFTTSWSIVMGGQAFAEEKPQILDSSMGTMLSGEATDSFIEESSRIIYFYNAMHQATTLLSLHKLKTLDKDLKSTLPIPQKANFDTLRHMLKDMVNNSLKATESNKYFIKIDTYFYYVVNRVILEFLYNSRIKDMIQVEVFNNRSWITAQKKHNGRMITAYEITIVFDKDCEPESFPLESLYILDKEEGYGKSLI